MFISKRVMIIAGAIVAIVMLAAGIGLAYALTDLSQTTTQYANLSVSATATAGAIPTPKRSTPKGQGRVVGVIQSLGTNSFAILVNGKRNVTVNVDSSTIYMHNGQKAAFSDLQVGQTVAILGTADVKTATIQATHVVISPPVARATPKPTASPTATATP